MKKALYLLGVFALLAFCSPVLAREATPTRSPGAVMTDNSIREARQEEINQRREELKEKLSQFADKRKARLVEQISDQINNLNERLTTHLLNVVENISEILGRIENKLGQDAISNDEINSAIVKAKNAIDKAKSGVNTQASKVYVVAIRTEEGARVQVGETYKKLRSDVNIVFELVKTAQKAVRDVAVLADKELNPEPSPSPSPSVSATPI